jgi:hypothetical protein
MLGNDDLLRGRAAYVQMIEDDLERLRMTPAHRHRALDYLAELDQRG